MKRAIFVTLVALASSAASAQPAADAEPTSATPSLEEQMMTLTGQLSALEESYAETKTDVIAMKKLNISGYVQGRYQYQESLDDTGKGGFSRFLVRRGRLKTTYTGDLGQFMLQVEANSSTVALRDAEATLFIPGTQQQFGLTVGQMKWPFSYEVIQGSNDRELPERSYVVRAFAPAERDRGAKFFGRYGFLRFAGGVFDGNGIDSRLVPDGPLQAVDNDKEKDLIGRLSFDLKWITGGVNGWYGTTIRRGDYSGSNNIPSKGFPRRRLGLDLQMYLDLLPFGGTALKGEYITGTTYTNPADKLEQFGVPASGWYVLLVQSIGLSSAVAIRYDYFDPENGRGAVATGSKVGARNAVGTLGVALMQYFGEVVKITAAYEIPMTATTGEAKDPKDNLLTLQLQARF